MEEYSLENLISYMEMEDEVLNQSNSSFDEQEFLKEIILEQPDSSVPACKPSSYACSNKIQNNTSSVVEGGGASLSFDETSFDSDTLLKSNSSNSIMSLEKCAFSPATCLLSFDKSCVEQAIHEPRSPMGSKRRTMGKDGFEFEPRGVHQATKKARRSSSETQDHLMAERKRRRELTQSIIALSAIIPGLKKMDKVYILNEAVNYMKQLEKRVKELENQNKDNRVNSAIIIWKSQASSNKRTTTCCETNKESLLEVEARVLEKGVLIRIHCEKQKDTVLKTHVLLEKLHLSIISSSVLPFGTSILIINIFAQMDDEHSMTTDDLVKNLRKCLSEAYDMQY